MIFALAMAPAGNLAAATSIQFRFGTTSRPLTGWRYEQMRSLAHYLDGQSQRALYVAQRTARRGDYSQMRMVRSMRDFAGRAEDFHQRMDRYLDNSWDLPPEVMTLDRSARRVNSTLHRTVAFNPVYDTWNDVVRTVDLMKQVLAGYRVNVPPAHGYPGGGHYDRGRGQYNQDYDNDYDRDYDRDGDHDHNRR
jgi:hypothetical protein